MSNPEQRNYFERHWRGELSLPVSYWVNGSLLSAVVFGVMMVVVDQLDFSSAPRGGALTIIALWLTIGAITVWQFVGIWRAATRYRVEKPAKVWGGVAKFFVSLGVLQFIYVLATQGIPQVTGFWQIANDQDPVGKYQFRVLRDSTELELSGGLSFGVSREAEKYLDTYPAVKIIHLNSQGGRVREARTLAKLIEARKLSTYTSTGCYSACIIPFAAGQQRLIRKGTHLGFHQYDFPGVSQDDFSSEYEKDKVYLIHDRGIDGAFVNKIFSTPHDQMWTPSDEELMRSHFVTDYAASNEVAFSGMQPADLPKLEKELLAIPMYAALQKSDPQAYGVVLEAVRDGVERGKSLSEVRAVTMPIIQKAYTEKLPHASDAAVIEFTNVAIEELKTLRKADPVLCYQYAFSKGDSYEYTQKFSAELNDRESAAIAQVIESYSKDIAVPTDQQFQEDFKDIGKQWASQYGSDLKLLNAPLTSPAEETKACEITLSLYEMAVSMPKDKAAGVLRYLFAQRAVQQLR